MIGKIFSVVSPYSESRSTCGRASPSEPETSFAASSYLVTSHQSLKMPVTKTYTERYIDLNKLQSLLRDLFPQNFSIRVSTLRISEGW